MKRMVYTLSKFAVINNRAVNTKLSFTVRIASSQLHVFITGLLIYLLHHRKIASYID